MLVDEVFHSELTAGATAVVAEAPEHDPEAALAAAFSAEVTGIGEAIAKPAKRATAMTENCILKVVFRLSSGKVACCLVKDCEEYV